MTLSVVPYSERPELRDRSDELFEDIWPEYNLHGDVINDYWGSLYVDFPDSNSFFTTKTQTTSSPKATRSRANGTVRSKGCRPESTV